MGESGKFLYLGNPNAMERPLIRQFSVLSSNSSDFPMLEFGVIVNEKSQTVLKLDFTYFDFLFYILNHSIIYGSSFSITPNFNIGKSLEFEDLAENRPMRGLFMA